MINQITLEGRLGQKPMMSEFPNGDTKTNFSIAHSRHVGNGEFETDWHNCFAKNRVAEKICEAAKGQQLVISGRLRTSVYEQESTKQKVNIVEIEVFEVFLGALPKVKDH